MINKRLWKELEEITNQNSNDFIAGPKSVENLFEWEATIKGPEKSPYDGGIFTLDIFFPTDYPFKPPKIQFKTLIFHPNISFNGSICLDLIMEKWRFSYEITFILKQIIKLLERPNPNVPFMPQIVILYVNNNSEFIETAKDWTELYAKPKKSNTQLEK